MYVSEWTNVPNDLGGHTVLSGHRDTVFTKLGDLEDGDALQVKYGGELFQYQIKKTWITDPDDRSVIVKKEDPTLTLTTCYPLQYLGSAPERYIVQAEKVEVESP
jgi:sortase A